MHDQMGDPFAGESDRYHFITQETRYLILQYVLAHPENLPSLEELDHAIPKGRSTIHEHIGRLRERGIVDAYELDPERRSRDLPSTFYGLTEYGIYVVEELGLLNAKRMLQGIYADMDKPGRIRQYEEAPRPERKSEDDLREELDDVVGSDDGDQETARKVTGIANLLERESVDEAGVEEAASARLELGSKVLDLLDSDSVEDREAVVSALVRIARTNVGAVVPVLSKLADVVGDLDIERQRGVSEILRYVSESDPELISEGLREQLLELYDRDLEHWQDDLDVARETLEAGLAIGENVDSDALRWACHERLGEVARRVGDLDAAEEYHQQSLDIKREVGDRHGAAKSLGNLGLVARQRGELEAAEEYHQQSLDIEREVGDRHGAAKSLNNLGVVAIERDDHDRAREHLTRAFELHVDIGVTKDAIQTAENLAWLDAQRGEDEEAIAWCERGLELIKESAMDFPDAADRLRTRKEELEGSDQQDLGSLYRTALREAASGSDEEATRLFRRAWDRREELDEDAEEFEFALSAGVGLLAEITLLDIEETTDAEENIADEITPVRDRLTDPADALFAVLRNETTEVDRPDVLADPCPIDEAEATTELEVAAYAELLDQLREPNTLPPRGPDTDAPFGGMTQPESQLPGD